MKKVMTLVIIVAVLLGAVFIGTKYTVSQQYKEQIKTLEQTIAGSEVTEKEPLVEEEVTITGATIEAGLREVGKLCTAEYYFTHVTNYEDIKKIKGFEIPLTKSGFIYSYEGDILAGIDFSKIVVDKNEAFKTITVTLPAPEIISSEVDPDSFKLYDEKSSIFNPVHVGDMANSFEALITEEEHKAIDAGLYERARANAVVLIENFLKGLDVGEYSISVIDE